MKKLLISFFWILDFGWSGIVESETYHSKTVSKTTQGEWVKEITLCNTYRLLIYHHASPFIILKYFLVYWFSDLSNIKADIIQLTRRSTVVWVLQNNLHPCTTWTKFDANTRIAIFNDVAIAMFSGTEVKIWRSYFQLFDYLGSDGDDMHMGEAALAMEVQIILNFLCNKVIDHHSKICCAPHWIIEW
jgi:hypothetical protein